MKKIFAIPMALAMCVPAAAQETSAPGTTEEATIDPARLAVAETTVDHLFPIGTYERMMKGTMDQMLDGMLAGLGGMTMEEMGGTVSPSGEDYSAEDKDKTLAELMQESDPNFEERMQISTRVLMDEMTDLMSAMEPQVRTTLTKIYARKYSIAQLNEMNDFFATDTGSAFARDYMMVFVDPEMMESMMSMVPELMQAMPNIMKKVEDATAHLPPVGTATETQSQKDDE
ncbi:DUF2059 domain-containing protein [Parasphingorhabdus sp.]|uniref:DUF2059 domain-containing protein n=1 Tax=Parasphingorhabdus sp. TaxID=2709688 RepID=UPI00326675E2